MKAEVEKALETLREIRSGVSVTSEVDGRRFDEAYGVIEAELKRGERAAQRRELDLDEAYHEGVAKGRTEGREPQPQWGEA